MKRIGFATCLAMVSQPKEAIHLTPTTTKIKRDQWGGTCITATGWFSSFVKEVGTNSSGLEHWSWVYVGGDSKLTRIIVTYQPGNPRKRKMMGETVWDQHLRYFEATGEMRP